MVVRCRQAGGDEGRVLCVLITCRTAEGVENTLLSRYFDGCDAAAQVYVCKCVRMCMYRCGRRADTGRMQAEVEAEVWESTRHDVAQISEDGEQMVSLVAGRWRVCPVHWPRELDELNVF
jgi:hypothetical protein